MEKGLEQKGEAPLKNPLSASDIELFHNAIKNHDGAQMEHCLLQKPEVLHAFDPYRISAVFTVVEADYLEGLEILIKHGLNINHRSEMGGETGLHLAIRRGSIDMVQAFINQGANIHLKIDNEKTALHVACLKDNILAIDELLSHGMDINEELEGQKNYFAYAARMSKKATICHLLSKGIEPWQLESALGEVRFNAYVIAQGAVQEVIHIIKEYLYVQQEKIALAEAITPPTDSAWLDSKTGSIRRL